MGRKNFKTFKLISLEEVSCRLSGVPTARLSVHEMVSVENSVGRVLAEDVVSKVNIPDRRIAVFDGYAVISSDISSALLDNPVTLKIVGETFSDTTSPRTLSPGAAVYTACGAPVSDAGDAVIKVENTRLMGGHVQVISPLEPGKNIALVGEDVKKGDRILAKSSILRPQDVGLLAGIGLRSVKVMKKPKVGIISVGDELAKSRKSGKISNNYALMISGLVSEICCDPRLLGIATDDLGQIKKAISKGVEKMDVVTTIAGCSVGVKDLVPRAIKDLGGSILLHGVKLSPGTPMGVGILKGKPVVMLPGYIVSAYAAFYTLLAPIITNIIGLTTEKFFPIIKARLTHDVRGKQVSTFMRVRLRSLDSGFSAEPVRGGSSRLSTLVKSNGYTIVPIKKELKKGELVDVVFYDMYEFSRFSMNG